MTHPGDIHGMIEEALGDRSEISSRELFDKVVVKYEVEKAEYDRVRKSLFRSERRGRRWWLIPLDTKEEYVQALLKLKGTRDFGPFLEDLKEALREVKVTTT